MITFGKSLLDLVDFNFLIADSFFESKGRKDRNIKRGYKFFSEGYVHDIWTGTFEGNIHVKAKCYKSQKKNEKPHSLSMHLKKEPPAIAIIKAHCSCEAGASQSCNHLVALAYLIQHLVNLGHSHIPEDVSCTSIAQQWNKPRGQEILPEPVMGVCFSAPSEKDKLKDPVTCLLYEARPKELQTLSIPDVNLLQNSLRQHNVRTPFSYLLANCTDINLPPPSGYPTFHRPEGSVLAYQLKDLSIPETPLQSIPNPHLYLPFPIESDLRNSLFNSILAILSDHPNLHKISLDLTSAISLETSTRNQSSSKVWKQSRAVCLTSSNFGEVCYRKKVPTDPFIERMLGGGPDLSHIPHIQHGIQNEDVARQRYIEYKKSKGCPVSVYRAGLVVNPLAPHLGASPDGHVVDTALPDDPNGVLEIKCPSSKKFSCTAEALECSNFCMSLVDDVPRLKKDHNYYNQIQGQMLICGVNWCDFEVLFKYSNELLVERVDFNQTFCLNMLDKLTNFYVTHMIDKI